MSKKILIKLLLVALGVAAAFFIYRAIFVSGSDEEEPGLVAVNTIDPNRAVVDDEFLDLLERFKNIDLRVEVFAHPVWLSLENFSRELIPEPLCRRNPFAEVGIGNCAPGVATSTLPSPAISTTTNNANL